jgi:5-oxoprolinase (ATP-hydrolysing)
LLGTTTGTNAVLENKGAKCGLIVTKGHKDILTVRRSQIPGGLGAWINYVQPEPLVPLERTVEVRERIRIDGEVHYELDEEEFREGLQDLKKQQPQAIAVSLLNSFANSVHEERVRAILSDEFGPDVEIVTSTDVLPEIQEYERTVTTTANAIVKPVVKRYMLNLQKMLANDTDTIRILKSDGDLTSVNLAGETPVKILMSGPAGGVKAVSHLVAKNTPYQNLMTFDMGGTSTDCALLSGTDAIIRRETEVGHLSVRAPSVDVKTVGAGGGSIALYNEFTKNFRVGPESSGATPGPMRILRLVTCLPSSWVVNFSSTSLHQLLQWKRQPSKWAWIHCQQLRVSSTWSMRACTAHFVLSRSNKATILVTLP